MRLYDRNLASGVFRTHTRRSVLFILQSLSLGPARPRCFCRNSREFCLLVTFSFSTQISRRLPHRNIITPLCFTAHIVFNHNARFGGAKVSKSDALLRSRNNGPPSNFWTIFTDTTDRNQTVKLKARNTSIDQSSSFRISCLASPPFPTRCRPNDPLGSIISNRSLNRASFQKGSRFTFRFSIIRNRKENKQTRSFVRISAKGDLVGRWRAARCKRHCFKLLEIGMQTNLLS